MNAPNNIFEHYGIKEVANVTFEALSTEQDPRDPSKVLYYVGDPIILFDTLKVTTIATTASTSYAEGGWSNPRLIEWDYGKEVVLSIEDALTSFESLRLMLGGSLLTAATGSTVSVRMNEHKVQTTTGTLLKPTAMGETVAAYGFINLTQGKRGKVAAVANPLTGTMTEEELEETIVAGDDVRFFWDEKRDGSVGKEAIQIDITSDTFPGTFKIYGDSKIRNQGTGKDSLFQFIIWRGKVTADVTLTMQAAGDPSTFSMTINALRDDENRMFSLIKY